MWVAKTGSCSRYQSNISRARASTSASAMGAGTRHAHKRILVHAFVTNRFGPTGANVHPKPRGRLAQLGQTPVRHERGRGMDASANLTKESGARSHPAGTSRSRGTPRAAPP